MDSSQQDRLNLLPILRAFLDETLDDWNYIYPSELDQAIREGEPLCLLDLRRAEEFAQGHIPGALNIFWLDLLKTENLAKLPMDREIVLICYVGHTASQALVLLRLLGYQVSVLKFGMGVPPDAQHAIAGWKQHGFALQSD